MDEERAASLLDDVVESEDMGLTSSAVDEAGGRQALIALALQQ